MIQSPPSPSRNRSKRIRLARASRLCFTALLLAALPASAEPAAQVGVVHPDGSVELDPSRFQPGIATGPGTVVAVDETLLSVSNGLLHVLRIGVDGCTSEALILEMEKSLGEIPPTGQPDPPAPLEAEPGIPDGSYPNGARLVQEDEPARVYVRRGTLNLFVYKCIPDGCRGFCDRTREAHIESPCLCYYFPDPLDPREYEVSESGCELERELRPWWRLADSVIPAHIFEL